MGKKLSERSRAALASGSVLGGLLAFVVGGFTYMIKPLPVPYLSLSLAVAGTAAIILGGVERRKLEAR